MKKKLLDRFFRYVKIDTQSNYDSTNYPSTKKQLDLAKILFDDCNEIGLSEILLDDNGYVTALLPKNINKDVPVVGFLAHMDTSPDFSGKNVNPNVIEKYNGKDIELNGLTISVDEFPILKNYIGETIITADGTTLLGADNKAGIAEILTAMEYLLANPNIKHGDIKIAFTPDEEVGSGVDYFDVKNFNADYAFTIDGAELGELEFENFNAARANIKISGRSIHPGSAKGIMVNTSLLASEFVNMLPPFETPATSEGYEGFYHITDIKTNVTDANINLIIRDFDTDNFEKRKIFLDDLVKFLNKKYNNRFVLTIDDEYLNMSEKIREKPFIMDIAKKAFQNLDIKPIIKPIRGGTDGARLSYMGLPCPNIFTGGHNFHGPYEFAHLETMLKAIDVIVEISKLNAE